MNHTVISQEQLDRLVADAAIGRAFREFIESYARETAERAELCDYGDDPNAAAELDADCAWDVMVGEPPEEAAAALHVAAADAARAVYARRSASGTTRTWELSGEVDGVHVGVGPGKSGGWIVCIDHGEELDLRTQRGVERLITARFGAEFCRGLLASGLPERRPT